MPRTRRTKFRPVIDCLDDRCLLDGSGLTPAQLATAYGLNGLTFGSPAQPASGAGETIAVVELGDDPNIQAELAAFDQRFNLPAPASLTVLGQDGSGALPALSFQGTAEESLDVEWAHALAPGAGIVVVDASSESTPDLMAAVKTAAAVPGVVVVSMSWGGPEVSDVTSYDSDFTVPGVTFVAASGDNGGFGGAEWPASSPYVLGVGGTTLQVDSNGNYLGETPWYGTSGGLSGIESEPPYQQAVQSTGARSVPDVAFDGDPNTGVQIYTIDPGSGQGSWTTIAGTSLGAPSWAAIIAIADQERAAAGSPSLGSLQTLTTLYSLPSTDFHVIEGGYNNQTGLGTPNGSALLSGLVTTQASAATTLPASSTPAPVASPPLFTYPIEYPPIFYNPVVITVISNPTPAKHKHAKSHHKPEHTKVVKPRVVHQKVAVAAMRGELPGVG